MPLRALRSHPSFLYRLPGTALVLIVCAVAIVLTLGLSGLFAWRDREASIRHARDTAGNVSLLVAEHAARLVETSDLVLRQAVALAGPPGAPLPDDRAAFDRLTALARSAPYVVSIWLVDGDGKAVLTTRQFPTPDLNAADRDYVQTLRSEGGLFIGPVENSRFTQEPLILLARPLEAAAGQFRGAAVVSVSPRYIRDIYKSFGLDYARSITLRKADGTILLRETAGTDDSADPQMADPSGREPQIAVERRVDGTTLMAEVAIPRASVMQRWHRRLWAYGTYGLAALLAVSAIGALAIKRTRREREAEDALQHAYDTLEERVHQRTAELERTNAQLESAVTDKEVLLKEVQHRVKNNLQVICSLLRLQAARIDDNARRAFDESLRRIQCMSLMQELLYRSDQPARIDFADYLRQLCDGLVRSTNPTGARLTVQAEPWTVDVDQATPLALIASELVSNALLHAFPTGHPGTVAVELLPDAEGMRLTVRDDGTGLPPGVPSAQRKNGGLGLVLVQALSQQASASLHIDRGSADRRGTTFTLTIPADGLRRSKAA
ncbi:sensor histidine kinase [Azospirillum rugosum]|uniref:histidine kinase n=1 Tax=Azospirillum rugosum TaxID=416170 RepID=A0ABS4SSU5_9PROT|nr:sensor histidine kinase [Azospirillum rugosum]MBP2295635.1 two-component sensor histidine kinase [Azospirillum rugosum]MDQ0529475.1 two-component sensor histidine kinase [Azospirillum rugosum]